MMQIQSQLPNLTMQLQEIKRGKEVQEELWCTSCRIYGHHKYNFLILMNYVAQGASNPVNTQVMPWCRKCQTRGHKSEECLYLQKIVSTPASLYCKFCKSVGHGEKDCRAYHLLKDKTVDTYLMKNNGKIQAD